MMQTLPKIMQIANLIQEKERGEEGKPKYIIWMNYSAQLPTIQRLLSSRRVLKSPPPHPFPALISKHTRSFSTYSFDIQPIPNFICPQSLQVVICYFSATYRGQCYLDSTETI